MFKNVVLNTHVLSMCCFVVHLCKLSSYTTSIEMLVNEEILEKPMKKDHSLYYPKLKSGQSQK